MRKPRRPGTPDPALRLRDLGRALGLPDPERACYPQAPDADGCYPPNPDAADSDCYPQPRGAARPSRR